MIGSEIITIVAWGGFAGLVLGALVRDLLRNYRAQHPRDCERRVPPRPAQVMARPPLSVDERAALGLRGYYEGMARQYRELRDLPTVEPKRTLR